MVSSHACVSHQFKLQQLQINVRRGGVEYGHKDPERDSLVASDDGRVWQARIQANDRGSDDGTVLCGYYGFSSKECRLRCWWDFSDRCKVVVQSSKELICRRCRSRWLNWEELKVAFLFTSRLNLSRTDTWFSTIPEARATHGSEVPFQEPWPLYSDLQEVTDDCLFLKRMQIRWQGLLDMTVLVARSLYLEASNADESRSLISTSIVERKLRFGGHGQHCSRTMGAHDLP